MTLSESQLLLDSLPPTAPMAVKNTFIEFSPANGKWVKRIPTRKVTWPCFDSFEFRPEWDECGKHDTHNHLEPGNYDADCQRTREPSPEQVHLANRENVEAIEHMCKDEQLDCSALDLQGGPHQKYVGPAYAQPFVSGTHVSASAGTAYEPIITPFVSGHDGCEVDLQQEAGSASKCKARNRNGQKPAAAQGSSKKGNTGVLFHCRFIVGINADETFNVVKRLVGIGGKNMKAIVARSGGAKVWIRGQGSWHPEGDARVESNDPLMIIISTTRTSSYEMACHMVRELLEKVQGEHKAFCIQRGWIIPEMVIRQEIQRGPKPSRA